MATSFKAEFTTSRLPSTDYASNGFRFATEREADIYAQDLAMRWTAVTDWRVVTSDDDVTDEIVDGIIRKVTPR